jgi:MYXO-CTERM domain-containing protein
VSYRGFQIIATLSLFTLLPLAESMAWSADAGAISVTVKYINGQPVDPSVAFLPPSVVFAGPALALQVSVISGYDLRGVHAQVDGIGFDLSPPASQGGSWTGVADIGALTRGNKTLVVTATDLLNETGTASIILFKDNPPIITISSPTYPSAVRSSVHVVATCSDDDSSSGCLSFNVMAGTLPSVSGSSSIDTLIDLSKYDGSTVDLIFSAQDSDGRSADKSVKVFVEGSSTLVEFAKAPGGVFDFDSSRLLYRNPTNDVVMLRQISNLSETGLGPAASFGYKSPYGWLTSSGAVWISMIGVGSCLDTMRVYDWHGGQATMFFEGCANYQDFQVNGDYAFWPYSVPSGDRASVTLRSLVTGMNTEIPVRRYADDAGTLGGVVFTLGPEGDIVGFGQDLSTHPMSCPVLRLQGASLDQFATVSMCDSLGYVVDDGVNVVFNMELPGHPDYQTALMDRSGNVVPLSDIRTAIVDPSAGYYAATGGWTAFLKKSASSGTQQVWVRSPDGVQTQLSIFGSDSAVEAVNATGEVMFINGGTRYFASPTSTPVAVSSRLGRSVARCSGWYIVMADTVFWAKGIGAGAGCTTTTLDAGAAVAADASSSSFDSVAVDSSISRDARIGDVVEISGVDGMVPDYRLDAGSGAAVADAGTDDGASPRDVDGIADGGTDLVGLRAGDAGPSAVADAAQPAVRSGGGCNLVGTEHLGGSGGWVLLALAGIALRRRRMGGQLSFANLSYGRLRDVDPGSIGRPRPRSRTSAPIAGA